MGLFGKKTVAYDGRLGQVGSDLRIYENVKGYGQVAYFAAFPQAQIRKFVKLTGIEMTAVT